MNNLKIIVVLIFSIVCTVLSEQEQEVVIIGTMHGVYGMTKKAYQDIPDNSGEIISSKKKDSAFVFTIDKNISND